MVPVSSNICHST